MKNKLLLLPILFTFLYSFANAQRYSDFKVQLLTPVDGDTINIGEHFNIYARITNLGADTFRSTDSAKYIIEFDGSPVIFFTGTDTLTYMLMEGIEILPGDSTVFGIGFTVFQGWQTGLMDVCVEVVPFNMTDTITDTVNANNKSCATILIRDPVGVHKAKEQDKLLSIYPNPAMTEANIRLELDKSSEVSVLVRDLSGRVVTGNTKKQLSAGQQVLKLDVSTLTPGVYICEIQVDGQRYTQKLQINAK